MELLLTLYFCQFDGETDKLGHPFVYFDYAFVDLYKSTYGERLKTRDRAN